MPKPETPTPTMQSYHMSLGAGLDGLVLRHHPRPRPGPHEVLVRVHAVSLNFRELMILVQGRYPLPVKPDVIGVSDGAGEVVALGEKVTHWKVGDRVMASIFPRWLDGPFSVAQADQLGGSLDGMLTEYRALDEGALVAVPPHLSYEEAATLPCAGVTAWNALNGGKPLQAADSVLTLGTGGVSLFALQLARLAGARVIATTSSEEKASRLRTLGAHEVINYQATPDWAAEVRRLTLGRGVDHVVEVGGATLPQSLRATAMGGEVALVGSVAGTDAAVSIPAVFASGASLRPVAVGNRSQFSRLATIVATHELRPVIARVFEFAEASAALAFYAQGQIFGKVVIRVGAKQ